MTVTELFQKERVDYGSALESCLAELRKTSPEAVAEVLVEVNSPEIPRPFRLTRPDIISGPASDPKITRVVKDEFVHFTPHEASLTGGAKLLLHPSRWDNFEICLTGRISDWEPYEAWVNKWLDVAEVRVTTAADFSGLIHQASMPWEQDGKWHLVIDMGSADLDALNELLSVLGSIGAESIKIGGQTPS
jgi:hypothetical protein